MVLRATRSQCFHEYLPDRRSRQYITFECESVQAHVTVMNGTLPIHWPCSQMWQPAVCISFTDRDDCKPCEDMPIAYTT